MSRRGPARLAALAVVSLFWWRVSYGEEGPTVLAKGLFSYQAPAGWSVSDLSLSYPVSRGPARDGFFANIHVDIVISPLALAPFVAANLHAARSTPGFRLIEEGPFATTAGLDGTRVMMNETVDHLDLRQAFYFFDGGAGRKIVISAACLTKDGPADAPIFDTSVKTFSLE